MMAQLAIDRSAVRESVVIGGQSVDQSVVNGSVITGWVDWRGRLDWQTELAAAWSEREAWIDSSFLRG